MERRESCCCCNVVCLRDSSGARTTLAKHSAKHSTRAVNNKVG